MNTDDTIENGISPSPEAAFEELMALYNEKTYPERFRAMLSGLRQPRDTREYKVAKIELQRQIAPVMALVLPFLIVALLALFCTKEANDQVESAVSFIEPDVTDFPDPDPIPEPFDPPPNVNAEPFDFTTPAPTFSGAEVPAATPGDPVSAKVKPLFVQPTKTSVIFSKLSNSYGGRTPGSILSALINNGGSENTEAAVMRSLRWLKQNQLPDGSWKNNKVAMTGLAILTFLAHGEAPGRSPEFGECVQKAIEFLMAEQEKNGEGYYSKTANGYPHAIATYAMCEAYGLTMNPNVKASADQALDIILAGQHPSGGWDYNWAQSERDDTSVMGWAAQAIKAAKMANFYHDPEALERASKLCVRGFKKNGLPEGGFGYTAPARGGLTPVGTLCLQFHGAADDPYVRNSLQNIIYTWTPAWTGPTPHGIEDGKNAVPGASPQYYSYYATQAVFQFGGDQWRKWNAKMTASYLPAQFIADADESGYTDDKGKPQETGWWENADASGDRPVMDTCLASLQLMVYYRYLNTTKALEAPPEILAATENDDIAVETNL